MDDRAQAETLALRATTNLTNLTNLTNAPIRRRRGTRPASFFQHEAHEGREVWDPPGAFASFVCFVFESGIR